MKLFISILFFLLLVPSLSFSQKIFDSKTPNEFTSESLKIVEKLNSKQQKNNRTKQYLVLKEKKAYEEIKPNFLTYYLEETEPCLKDWTLCLKAENKYKEFLTSFYTNLQKENINDLSSSIKGYQKSTKQLDHKRAKFIYLALNSLKLAIHEIDGPNDDSKSGGNFIEQYFIASGIASPKDELTHNKTDEWAWCAAYITALYNQAGGGFTFLTQGEYKAACKEMGKKSHCHPVQVDFILNWAKKKKQVEEFNIQDLEKTKPGDLLALINPKNGQASHIGIYIAKAQSCQKGDNNCWVYTIEGNAGPFINDALEYDWKEIEKIVKDRKIKAEDFERLLDRVTIVKRPIQVWDFRVNVFD